jgi:prolipoprotein diacylglyceryl transferase
MQLFIHWNPSPDFVSFGIFSIKWYGIFWGLSLISCFLIGRYVFQKLNRDDEKITLAIQYVFIGGLIGARLAHIIFYSFDYYGMHPLKVFAVHEGGLASHGGFVGGLIGLFMFCKRNKEFQFFWLLDMGMVMVVMLASLIRLGNLMNSELCGKITNVPWAFIFQNSPEVTDAFPRHAVVLYESIAYFFIQIFMLVLFNKYKESKPGIYLVTFLISVFTVRFMLEFYKEPDGFVLLNIISKTQLLNLPFIITGVVLAYFVMNNKLQYSNTNR